MTIISGNTDCGNSPKMKFLKEFNIAFANGDKSFLADHITENVVWDIVGDQKIEGRESFVKEFEKMKSRMPSELIFDKVITHEKAGAVYGMMKMKNGESYAFADIYEFSNAKGEKVKSIVSLVIKRD